MEETQVFRLIDFEPLVGSMFTLSIEGGDESLDAELIEASPAKGGKIQEDARDPFTLIFRLPRERQLGQHLYQLEHREMGKNLVFLVPFKNTEEGHFMEAVFN